MELVEDGCAPLGVVSILLGDLGVVVQSERRTVVKADLLDDVAVGLKVRVSLRKESGTFS